MARYTGPKSKIARKFGEPIYGPDKALERRNYPSGQHGLARRRRKISEYGVQLKEKQKANSLRSNRVSKYSWLEWDGASMSGKLLNVPERSDIPENIKEQLIVELYSK